MKTLLLLFSLCIVLIWTARHHAPTRRKIKAIWHGHVTYENNTSMLRATAVPVAQMEVPEKDMNNWTKSVFEQQADSNVDVVKKIPKIIHQYWNGKTPPKKLMEHCRNLHPDWEYRLWTPENIHEIPSFFNKKIFDAFSKQQVNGQSDIVRFEVLRTYGGIYLDADTVCFRSLEPLRKHGFFAGYHNFKNPGIPHSDNKNIASAVIGSIKNHSLVQRLVTVLENDISHAKGPAWKKVGPGLLTRIISECKSCNVTGDIFIYPYWAFVPYHHREQSIIKSYITKLHELPRVKKYDSFCMNLWGTTFKWWDRMSRIKTPTTKKVKQSDKVQEKNPGNICKSFPSIFTMGNNYEESLEVLLYVNKICAQVNVDWTLAYGTVLGWARSKTFLPYEDDMDVVIQKKDAVKLKSAISSPFCYSDFWGGFKIYKCSSPRAGKYSWRWPFVDVWDGSYKKNRNIQDPKIMFPSKPAVFAGYLLRAPNDVAAHLKAKYTNSDWKSECVSRTWSHRKERTAPNKKLKVLCSSVKEECFADKMIVYRYPPLNTMDNASNLYQMLSWFNEIAKNVGIQYSLAYGSLLGWRREGHVITNDTDLDIQIGKDDIVKLTSLIDKGIAYDAADHPVIEKQNMSLLVRKSHNVPLSQRPRVDCMNRKVKRQTDKCAFTGPVARVVHMNQNVDIFLRCQCEDRKKSVCAYCQTNHSLSLPEVYPCRFGPVDTYCLGPAHVKHDLEIKYNNWMIVK